MPEKLIIDFETWKERNPDLHNYFPCPYCDAQGFIVDMDAEFLVTV